MAAGRATLELKYATDGAGLKFGAPGLEKLPNRLVILPIITVIRGNAAPKTQKRSQLLSERKAG